MVEDGEGARQIGRGARAVGGGSVVERITGTRVAHEGADPGRGRSAPPLTKGWTAPLARPPLTLGVTGRLVTWWHRAPLVFNIQDVFPDAAVATGAITDRRVIAAASALERASYRLADAVTVLSDDLRGERRAPSCRRAAPATVHVIPNFVDTEPRSARSTGLTALPPRARHRRRAGGALRRQRRVLAVARRCSSTRPADLPRRDVPDQRWGLRPGRAA